MSLEVVRRWIDRIPRVELDYPLVIDEKTEKAYTPRKVLSEVTAGTELGRRLQAKIEARSLTAEITLKDLAKIRLKMILEGLPQRWGIGTYGMVYRKDEILKVIENEEGFGKKIIEEEIERMKLLMRS